MSELKFRCRIDDGAVLKHMTAVFPLASTLFDMTIKRDRLIFSQTGQPESAFIMNELYAENFSEWYNNFEEDEISRTFPSLDFHSAITTAKRSESVIIFIEDPYQICISIIRKVSTNSSSSVSYVSCTEPMKPIELIGDEIYSSLKFPNIVEQIQTVLTSCQSLLKHNCDRIKLIGKKSVLILSGMKNGTVRYAANFGDVTEEETTPTSEFSIKGLRFTVDDPNEYVSFNISSKIVELISKVVHITPNSNVKIYIVKGKPVKITCHVFVYGITNLYLIPPS